MEENEDHQVCWNGYGKSLRNTRVCGDLSAALCILLSTVCGIPVSTTHVKTTAIMGVGAEKRASAINLKVVRDMVLAWVLTFPGCGVIGYGMAKLLIVWLG